MHQFLTANRAELIARCRAKVALRAPPGVPEEELAHGVSIFLDQLIKTLIVEQTASPLQSRRVSGPSGGGRPALSEIGESATLHGKELQEHGFTVEEVVHDYGDLCQSISDLAVETDAPIGVDEFRTLNRCLDNAIASAVTEFGYQRDFNVADRQTVALNERLGFFAHELRNQLCTATLALSIIKQGNVGLGGATGGVLDRALVGLSNLIDRSLAEVRMTAGMPLQHQLYSLADFIAEIKLSASLEADVKDCVLVVSDVDPLLAVDVDRDLLLSAVGNLLQNAFKFTHLHTEVTLNAYALADRILIDVLDHCGGLSPGSAENMFVPFVQEGEDRSGLGLGLSIARRSVEANGGVLSVRNLAGSGCVFTIDLPRHSLVEGAPPLPQAA
ncbi:sensor histidine kinase [Pseudoxanthomonas sacheonensis]|uniref:histidine kinase n=1 Tax=Pseudoxanthomonas sacheonensis TaxID=443615 RepID=A0ABU1RVR7_9GAMM|nr:HAMP domain-containing sensor histidine kinase [Pseudoxanthomonas sacheonensis]MDR6842385.1 signal transduction histidine kinase [Pseudoxanthomonas sacheonensis]